MNELTSTNNTITAQGFNASRFSGAWEAWIKDRAGTTQAGYNVTVKAFLEWLAGEGTTAPTRETIISYREYLLSPHPSRKTGKEITFSADTAARYFRGCKMFFSFLEDQGFYKDITKNVRSPKTQIRDFKRDSLEREDCLRILKSIDTCTETGKRDYCMMLACISCGLRIIELQRADIGDIETHAGERRLYIQGKGHLEKDDYKKIEAELWEALEDYLNTRGTTDKTAPLFAAVTSNAKHGGGRLTEPDISRILKGVLKKAGYDSRRITAHSLRHTSVTLDRKAGASLEEASKHARHSSITITQRYDHALEKAEAKDERRIMDYLFSGKKSEDPAAPLTSEATIDEIDARLKEIQKQQEALKKEADLLQQRRYDKFVKLSGKISYSIDTSTLFKDCIIFLEAEGKKQVLYSGSIFVDEPYKIDLEKCPSQYIEDFKTTWKAAKSEIDALKEQDAKAMDEEFKRLSEGLNYFTAKMNTGDISQPSKNKIISTLLKIYHPDNVGQKVTTENNDTDIIKDVLKLKDILTEKD